MRNRRGLSGTSPPNEFQHSSGEVLEPLKLVLPQFHNGSIENVPRICPPGEFLEGGTMHEGGTPGLTPPRAKK